MLVKVILVTATVILSCEGQRNASIPLSWGSFNQILRAMEAVPVGRTSSLDNIIIRHYSVSGPKPKRYRVSEIKRLFSDPEFDPKKPTVLYAHGFLELFTDASVRRVMRAYVATGQYNALLLDWSNLAFGHYLTTALGVHTVGNVTGKALWRLVRAGLPLGALHLVGHSMGAHVLGAAARYLRERGMLLPRLTGLDPAYPGFYPAILGPAMTPQDAEFVDVLHTDGGGFGSPQSTGHADFWPNEGKAKQPGCLSVTVPLTVEDFCSHWRSWEYWAESVAGGEFLARRCADYDSFLRGRCRREPLVYMGLRAPAGLRGNFYLRTAAKDPYALGERGAD